MRPRKQAIQSKALWSKVLRGGGARRMGAGTLAVLLAISLGSTVGLAGGMRRAGQEGEPVSRSALVDDGTAADPSHRYREGSQIRDRNARFQIAGDRIEYVPSDGHPPMMVLENLALERVKNEVVRVGGAVRWDIVANVTEFESHNYILLQRASLTSSAASEP